MDGGAHSLHTEAQQQRQQQREVPAHSIAETRPSPTPKANQERREERDGQWESTGALLDPKGTKNGAAFECVELERERVWRESVERESVDGGRRKRQRRGGEKEREKGAMEKAS